MRFVFAAVLCILAGNAVDALPAAEAVSSDRPNFVWIIADDMSPDTAAYGCPGVHTPHLDRFAAAGTRYTQAYASAPVCSSSRSAFILGCYQTTTGLHAHDVVNRQPLPKPYRTLPALLREAGWFVTNSPAPGATYRGKKLTKAKTHYNFAHDPAKMYDGVEWRKRAAGQPFFAQFQIREPHRAFPIPEQFDEQRLQALRIPENYPDHPLTRRDWYAYLRSVEQVDRHVGQIIEQLEAEGVLENTIIMFFGDHGRPMPWGKQWLSVEGLRVPLLMRGPTGQQPGSVETRMVSLIDLAPSMLSLAGLDVPEWMEGEAILGSTFPQRDRLFAARDRCGDADDRIRAVITASHLLVKNYDPQLPMLNWSSYKESSYPGMALVRVLHEQGQLNPLQSRYLKPHRDALELYDLQSDAEGIFNIADQPRAAHTVAKLKRQFESWTVASGDRGALPPPETEPPLATMQVAKRKSYQNTWKKRGLSEDPSDLERTNWWLQQYGLPKID